MEGIRRVELRAWESEAVFWGVDIWNETDPLERMFRLGHWVIGELAASGIRLALGRVEGLDAGEWAGEIERLHPVTMQSPFEGCDDVAGGVWRGEGLDGLLKLRFSPGAEELPAHIHEFSDRVLMAVEGEGQFHASRESLEMFSGQIESWNVGPGSVVAFPRGLVHTFNAGPRGLTLLSFHEPFFDLDDPRQYALPSVIWTARHDVAQRNEVSAARE